MDFYVVSEGLMGMLRSSKNRSFSRIGALAFLGLAVCIFAWGLQYKLSLYDSSQAATHQVPKAKLLSSNEQSRTAKIALVDQTEVSSSVFCVVVAFFSVFLFAPSLLNPLAGQSSQWTNRSWRLHFSSFQSDLFVRPPPVLGKSGFNLQI